MINAGALVTDLKAQLKALTADLDAQAHDDELPWSKELRAEYEHAREHERTGLTWSAWLAGEVDQAAVAWLVAASFVRFCEDNRLIDGLWLAGPGDRLDRAVDNETAYYADNPTYNARDWLQQAFAALADLPAGRGLVDPEHNPVWRAPISADAAKTLVDLWRRRNDDGGLVHDFTDPSLGTRFLGDLYQDLSEHARKTYALLQTPVFVEKLILEQTLEPAIDEFGLSQLKVIDPTCGSGHFLLGAFEKLYEQWQTHDPDLEVRARVQRALDSLHGVDINPFAVAITRFRLTVAALKAIGERRLADAPVFTYRVAIGDSLLAAQGEQGDLFEQDAFEYANEDVGTFGNMLDKGRYHVVVGNPPYVTPKDKKANENYREAYKKTCHRQYALSVPFAELFFRLAKQADPTSGAGYVGQITANSFMKREFGTKLVDFLAGGDHFGTPVDLTGVYDTSGAYIPGHGTPTVILVGRRRSPHGDTVRAVLGIRGEPGKPDDPSKGRVWTEMVEHLDESAYEGEFVSVVDLPRESLVRHPWSLAGGAAPDVMDAIQSVSAGRLMERIDEVGFGAVTREDNAYMLGAPALRRLGVPEEFTRPLVEGEFIRDHQITDDAIQALWPYDTRALDAVEIPATTRILWPMRSILVGRVAYGNSQLERGLTWFEYSMFFRERYRRPLSIAFAFVATHNHFVLDRGGKVFNRTAPVIKLPAKASEDDHLDLIGVLNSSLACFWLKQVCHDRGNGGYGGGIADQEWERFYEYTGTKLQEFPLPDTFPRERARALDCLAQDLAASSPSAVPVAELAEARERWYAIRRRMLAKQEELDWDVYRRYGLLDDDLTFDGDVPEIALGERAFEIALARRVKAGKENTEWFSRHNSTPITEIPVHWPADYRALVQRRLDLIESDRKIGLLERPEHKRRWATRGWQAEQDDALRETILDRLEDPDLWRDAQGPVTRSVAQLADLVRNDETIADALAALIGTPDVELTPALRELLDDQAVPAQAAYRYKPSGIVKFREWQQVWELQRREDRGETVDIAVPPKYKQADFLKPAYWRARGKLDVPKERFIAYPGTAQPGDPTPVLGWAGWNHAEQALALARMVTDNPGDESLLAGLAELEPWLHQWHAEVDPAFGTSPAQAITALLDQQLAVIGKTRDDLEAWRPAARTKRAKETT